MRGPPEMLQQDKPVEYAVDGMHDPPLLQEEQNNPIILEPIVNSEEEEEDVPVEAEDLIQEYGWMENEEEFDREVLEDIEQEEYMERCFEEMWEQEEQWIPANQSHADGHAVENGELDSNFDKLSVAEPPAPIVPDHGEDVPRSDCDS